MPASKKVFYSFHYKDDVWRVQTVKNIGAIEEQPLLSSNDWERVKRGGETAIKNWIHDQMKFKNAVVVLIGENTANRDWVIYEIEKAWNMGKAVLGVRIHNLKDQNRRQSNSGPNPFERLTVNGMNMSMIAPVYNPSGYSSETVYASIKDNIHQWIEEAKLIRSRY